MATKTRHIHKLRLHKYSTGRRVYFCTLPDCNYKAAPALIVGKRSLCNICGEPFILTEYSIRLVKPHCEGCHRSKDKIQLGQMIDLTEKTIEAGTRMPPLIPVENDLSSRLKAITNSNEEEQEEEI